MTRRSLVFFVFLLCIQACSHITPKEKVVRIIEPKPTWVERPRENLEEEDIVIIVVSNGDETMAVPTKMATTLAKDAVSKQTSQILSTEGEKVIKESVIAQKHPTLITPSSLKYFNSLVESYMVKKVQLENVWSGKDRVAIRFVVHLSSVRDEFTQIGIKYKSFIGSNITDQDIEDLSTTLVNVLAKPDATTIKMEEDLQEFDIFYEGLEEEEERKA